MDPMRTTPWNVLEMTLEQAEAEYERMRKNRNPSTADLRRENALMLRIRELRLVASRRAAVLGAHRLIAGSR